MGQERLEAGSLSDLKASLRGVARCGPPLRGRSPRGRLRSPPWSVGRFLVGGRSGEGERDGPLFVVGLFVSHSYINS